MKYAIGLDIGGTNIKALAVTPGGRVLAQVVVPTGDTGRRGWQINVHKARSRLERLLKRPSDWTGLAAPGLASAEQNAIAFMPGRLFGLEDFDWRKYLKTPHPVPVLNDAHAALRGEVWRGAARQSRNAILITLGTGVGGAAMVDGVLLHGHIGRAGSLGHISLDPDGAPDITNTPGSLEDAIGECTVRARSGGRFASTLALISAVCRDEPEANKLWLASVKALAAGVASLVNAFDPEVVVIGGGISRAGPMLFQPLSKFLNHFEWRPGGARVRLIPARLGDRAGAFGAAWHAIHFHPPGL